METFSFNVNVPFEETINYKTLVTEFESGKEKRRKRWLTPKRIFSLSFVGKNETDIDAIWDFYQARNGRYDPFSFVNPIDGVTYTVRFAEDNLTRELIAYKLHNSSLKLVQVL